MTAEIINLANNTPLVDESQILAESARRTLPFWSLVWPVILLTMALLGTIAVDVTGIFHLLQSQAANPVTGEQSSSKGLLLISSFQVLIACIAAGILWKLTSWWPRLAAAVIYFAILVFLSLNIHQVYATMIAGIVGSTVLNAELGSVALSSNAPPPVLFSCFISFCLAILYSIPGILFVMLEASARTFFQKAQLRSEAISILAEIDHLKRTQEHARILRAAANHASDPEVMETEAKVKVFKEVTEYRTIVEQTIADNIPPLLTDPKPIRDHKLRIVQKARTCLEQAEAIHIN